MPTPRVTTFSTSSSAPGACASPRWPCTTFARSSVSIGPRAPRQPPPGPARIVHRPSRAPAKRCRRANRCRRLPLFLDADAIRGGVPLDAASLGLAEHGRGLFRGRVRFLAAGPVDERLRFGDRRGTHLPSGRDGGCRLCPVVWRPALSSRHTVGGWRRHLSWHEVDAFCRRTCPWDLLHNEDALVSFDEHTIPRWTRKFHIGKS